MQRNTIFLVLAIIAGCTATQTSPTTSTRPDDGTAQIDQSKTFALISGTVDASVGADVTISVNHASRNVVVASDSTFLVRDVPTGSVTFECAALDIRGSITIDNVQPGEIIEVTVRKEGKALVIVIDRRTPSTEAPREVTTTDGPPLEIHANNVCFLLKPGTISRDIVVFGNNVSLIGGGASCDGNHTVLAGKLVVKGNRCSIFDIDLRGAVVVTGNATRIQDSCSRCFGDSCAKDGVCHDDCDDSVSCHEGCNGRDGGATFDSGGVTNDGGSTFDSGTTVDAGVDTGLPPPSDSGTATD